MARKKTETKIFLSLRLALGNEFTHCPRTVSMNWSLISHSEILKLKQINYFFLNVIKIAKTSMESNKIGRPIPCFC